ncbi:LacI family DNA-binding transcriptional regulator [Deinococcus ruber]|uniref:LacI family transcriptional regulator n=1 Tax=Deinococcus ruber TaxID=1848197 RepID=A0A918CIM5_9DEIO|nr:LacI family DNA-binding transcriptional regulator [Deinococcus ruber]GGR26049.1 LacI family transcriptional regulator [Deinococcus ruber]
MIGLEEVAKLARVSPATASRALHRPELVALRTRERVEQAALELGYRPNVLARSLRTRGSRTLGLIVTDILNPFHATLAKGVQDAAEAQGYTVLMFNSDEQPDKERRALETLQGHLPQGLIVVPTSQTGDNLRIVPGLPVVELDRTSGLPDAHSVMVDNVSGAREAVAHLTGLGHRRIGMIVGRQDVSTARERLQGYREALAAAGLPYLESLVLPGNHREADGRLASMQLLSQRERPTALFVGNNEMTVGAVLAARDLGLELPRDLSIVGFDDSRWAQTMSPALTVVAQPTYELGMVACQWLLSVIQGNPWPENVRLPTVLIHRSSTAPPQPTRSPAQAASP